MNIVQCQFCRKPFAAIGGRICPDCMNQLDLDYITVRDFIDENPTANIDRISDETEVPRQHIMHLIKEGRLILNTPGGDGGGAIVCESCHKPIKTGRLCEVCMKKISTKIDGKASHSKPQEAEKSQPDAHDMSMLGKIR